MTPEHITPDDHQAFVDAKRQKRMQMVDKYPADIRVLIHDYGLSVVKAHMDLGVTKARHIRHLVETTLDEFSPTRGACSSQGIRRAPGSEREI